MQSLKKIIKFFNVIVLVIGLLIPVVLFLNRFLIPDVSYDSLNYHLFLGFKGLNWQSNQFEFYSTGIYNFSPILDVPGYILMRFFGYRIGSIGSLIFLYLLIFVLYKIFRLYFKKIKILEKWWFGIVFVSMFLSFESFLQIATYYIDIEVAFLMLLSTYFLFRYEKSKKIMDLILSSIVTAIFVLGKMTSWYYLFPYFGYLLTILLTDKKQNIKQKIAKFVLVGLISVSLVIPWLYRNFSLTNNPVFPFYNGIFKSKYFLTENFSQVIFGGRGFFEKLFYGVVSIKNPVRLGEVHDLFTDYKISIYFIISIIIFVWAWWRKNKLILKLSIFYLIVYLCWSFTFGYLRYGLILEFLGGLLTLMWFCELKSIEKYFLILPIVLIMAIQGKRIVNMSLAYDISFRPGYFYNRQNYLKEIKNFNSNSIKIDKEIIDKYKPNVYLNCAIPEMTYYVMSEFNNLPVLNIDFKAYDDLNSSLKYTAVANGKLNKYLDDEGIRFVTVVAESGLNSEYLDCVNNLKNKQYIILNEVSVDNFLGYSGQKLVAIFGKISK